MFKPGLPVLFFLLSLILIKNLPAQVSNDVFYDSVALIPLENGKLSLLIDQTGYFRNNEYFEQLEGYTLFGIQLAPALAYRLGKNILLYGGAFLKKDFGRSGFSEVQPLYRFKFQKNNFSFIFGTLEGSLNHRLSEPVYDFERVIYQRIENGLQFNYRTSELFLDTWVNWENQIFPAEDRQELLIVGFNGDYSIIQKENFRLNLPLEILVYHLGGQINITSKPITTIVNLATGFDFRIEKNNFTMGLDQRLLYAINQSPATAGIPYDNGFGIYSNPYLETRWLNLMLTYWYGDGFVNPRGSPVFSSWSFSPYNPGQVENVRNLIMLRILKDFELAPDTYLSLRAEPYYNLADGSLQFSTGFYLNSRLRFTLLKKEKIE